MRRSLKKTVKMAFVSSFPDCILIELRCYCPSIHPFNSEKAPESLLLQIVVTINGKRAKALVDIGCTTTLVMTGITDS